MLFLFQDKTTDFSRQVLVPGSMYYKTVSFTDSIFTGLITHDAIQRL